jgi:hypothetical protein
LHDSHSTHSNAGAGALTTARSYDDPWLPALLLLLLSLLLEAVADVVVEERLRVRGVFEGISSIFSFLTSAADGSLRAASEGAGKKVSVSAAPGAGAAEVGFFAFSASSLDRRSICRSVLIFRFFFN